MDIDISWNPAMKCQYISDSKNIGQPSSIPIGIHRKMSIKTLIKKTVLWTFPFIILLPPHVIHNLTMWPPAKDKILSLFVPNDNSSFPPCRFLQTRFPIWRCHVASLLTGWRETCTGPTLAETSSRWRSWVEDVTAKPSSRAWSMSRMPSWSIHREGELEVSEPGQE